MRSTRPDKLKLPKGITWKVRGPQPFTSENVMKWTGMHITYESSATSAGFAAVLVLIYILVVGWFQSFKTPIVIMAAIPSPWWNPAGHGLLGPSSPPPP